MVAAERRQVDERVKRIIELKNKVVHLFHLQCLFSVHFQKILHIVS